MFYAYVLKSVNHDFYYKGHCENLEERLKEHNSGKTVSIKPYIPFELVYREEFNTREEAVIREKYFKSSAGRRYLKNKLDLG
jgi:putative endonuclease